jgi:RNA polymerase sigma factor (sigma-70 family)
LYDNYGRKLYAYALSKWKLNEDEAWELIYKTLYKILDVIDRYRFEDEKKFAGFIFQSFVNNLRNYYHEKKKKPEQAELNETRAYAGNEENDDSVDEPNELMKLLKEEMERLEDWQRILLLMRAQDYSYEEIAKFVSKPADQLKVYYLRLKKKLTDKINSRVNENKNAE